MRAINSIKAAVGIAAVSLSWQMYAEVSTDTVPVLPGTLHYLHLYADSEGESHFAIRNFEFSAAADTGSGRTPSVHRFQNSEAGALMRLRPGTVETWHQARRRNLVFVLQGEVDVTASDGEIRRLRPGSVMLMDDTTGKGHVTAHVGVDEHIVLSIPLTDEP